MADQFIIEVVVDPARAVRGNRRVRGELGRTETAADRLGRTLRRAFAITSIVLLGRQLVTLADEFTNVQNRLRTVTDGEAELATVTNELFAIANRTRSEYGATAEVFARVGLAAKNLGRDQQELLQFTESLNQAVLLSGASATEAQAGLIQLSQGLASGALRGDELRSVLEQLPVVADVIAQSLGVTRGELRVLGQEGKISAEIVLDAFKEARIELEERFGEAVPTVAQSLTVLRNRVLQVVGAQDQATGASRALSETILDLSENVTTVGAAFEVVFGIIREFVPIVRDDLLSLGATFDETFNEIDSIPDIIALVADRTLGLFNGIGSALLALFTNLTGPALKGLTIDIINGLIDLVEGAIDSNNALFFALNETALNTGRALLNFLGEIAVAAAQLATGQFELAKQTASEAVEVLQGQLAAIPDQFTDTFLRTFEALDNVDIIPRLENTYADAAAGLGQAVLEGFFTGLDVTLVRDVLGDIRERAAQANADLGGAGSSAGAAGEGMGELAEGASAAAAAVGELNENTAQLPFFLSAATGAAVQAAAAAAEAFANQPDPFEPLKEFGASTFEDLKATAVDFAVTGENSFEDFVGSALESLQRLAAEQALNALLGLLTSSIGGPAGGFFSSLFGGGRAGGGDVSPNKAFLVGEDGPELFTPPGAGEIVPAGQTAAIMSDQRQAAAPVVNVAPPQINVRNVVEGEDDAEREGEILNVIRRNRRTIRGLTS